MRINSVDTLPSNGVSLRTDAAATGQPVQTSAAQRREVDARNRAAEAAAMREARHDAEQMKSAVDSANESLTARNAQVQFAMDSDSGRVLVKLVDVETRKVLRQIPNEEMLRIAKNIDRMRGVGVDQAA